MKKYSGITLSAPSEPASDVFLPFPSPRTWHSNRRSMSKSDTMLEEVLDTTDNETGVESLAEMIAQACIEDEELVSTTGSLQEQSILASHNSPAVDEKNEQVADAVKSVREEHAIQVPRRTTSGGWNGSPSTEISQGGSPTSVLGEGSNEAWDLLFAAVGKIQKYASGQEQEGSGGLSLPRATTMLPSGTQTPPLVPLGGNFHGRQCHSHNPSPARSMPHSVRRNNRRDASPAGMVSGPPAVVSNMKNGTPPRSGQKPRSASQTRFQRSDISTPLGIEAVIHPLLITRGNACTPPRAPTVGSGTGVFLPRAAPSPASTSGSPSGTSHQDGSVKKTVRPSPPVYLPARLVHQFGLAVDHDNNVVLNRKPSPTPNGRKAAVGAPVIKLAVDNVPSPVKPVPRRSGGRNQPQPRGRSPSPMNQPRIPPPSANVVNSAMNLPSDWQY